jgi:threonine dehydrogenase-like Zn-dependent dehydrogenase
VALWQLAALADAAAAPYGGLIRAGLQPGELTIIVGGGPRGAFGVALALALGAHPAVLATSEAEAERARRLGARIVVTLPGADAVPGSSPMDPASVRATIDAEAAALGVGCFGAKVLETTASAPGRHFALGLSAAGDSVLLLDGGDDRHLPQGPSWERLARGEVQLLGVSACHPDLLPELCALAVRGLLPVAQLVTAVGQKEAAAALEARRSGELLELPVVVFGAP